MKQKINVTNSSSEPLATFRIWDSLAQSAAQSLLPAIYSIAPAGRQRSS